MTNFITAPKRNLLLDCDGVLLDWIGGFIRYAEARLGRSLDPAGPPDFDLQGWLGVDKETHRDMIAMFNAGEGGYFGALRPLPGAVEALTAAKSQGRDLSIITACSVTPAVVAQRTENLEAVFGPIFSEIHVIDFGESKRDLLEGYRDVSWVEDKAENALLGAEVGHRSYLIRASHNEKHRGVIDHPNLTWVEGWECIQEYEKLAA